LRDVKNAYRSAWRDCRALLSAAILCIMAGTSCAKSQTATETEIPCPKPGPEVRHELTRGCGGVEMPFCPEFRDWYGRMLNYCRPLG
jgi:hypothetical protein